jgi:hypothetical protein
MKAPDHCHFLITKNIFKSPCMTSMYQYTEAVISIFPQLPKRDAKIPPYNKNIVITDNEFHLFDYLILYALSVDGIDFSNNRLSTVTTSNRFITANTD